MKLVGEASVKLSKSKYEEAFALLDKKIDGGKETANAEAIRKLVVWHLRAHTVPSVIRKGYSTVELTKVKSMLGAS